MARSQRKTTIAVLRGILGKFHGREDQFAKLTKHSTAWVKKVSAGITPLHEATARLLELETGISLSWLMGPPAAPPVNGQGKPYTHEYFGKYRMRMRSGELTIAALVMPLNYMPRIAAIGSAAGDMGKVSLFRWRLESFLDECAELFGFDNNAYATTRSIIERAAKKTPKLARIAIHDKTFDFRVLSDPRVMRAARALYGTGQPIRSTRDFASNEKNRTIASQRSSRARR
jgi:hypothetical protein